MAMLPFCGYNMGDYFAHWLAMRKTITRPPKVFMVNWFRKDAEGKFLWPGYGENLRVLIWMLDRIHHRARAIETAVGAVPDHRDLDLTGLDLPIENLRQALAVDAGEWKAEMASAREFFDKIGSTMPQELRDLHREITASLDRQDSRRAAIG
jgi:phosphoenolpyruvate carboxykinase (GTP)